MSKRLAECQRVIGYAFADPSLLEVALTHSSVRTPDRECNERQEFLGDSVLGLVITEELYRRLPDQQEGELTRIKSAVVSRGALYRVSTKLGLTRFVEVAKGVARREELPVSLTANLVESVIGAIYLDGGFFPAREFVLRHLGPEIEDVFNDRVPKNFKSLLQQEAQSLLNATPIYKTVEEEGPDHRKHFIVAAMVKGTEYGRASGVNKREAEQEAARHALEAIKYRGRRRRRRLPELRDPRDRHRDRVRGLVGQSRDADDWRAWAEASVAEKAAGPTPYAIAPEADEGFVDDPIAEASPARPPTPDEAFDAPRPPARRPRRRPAADAPDPSTADVADPTRGASARHDHPSMGDPSMGDPSSADRSATDPSGGDLGPEDGRTQRSTTQRGTEEADDRPRRRGRRGRRSGRGRERGAEAAEREEVAPGDAASVGPDGRAAPPPALDPLVAEIPLAFMEPPEPASWPDGPGDPDPPRSTRRPRREGGARAPAAGRAPRRRATEEPLLSDAPTKDPAAATRGPASGERPAASRPPAGRAAAGRAAAGRAGEGRAGEGSLGAGPRVPAGPGFGAGVLGGAPPAEAPPGREASPPGTPASSSPVPPVPPVASVEARRRAPASGKKPPDDGGFGVGL